MDLNELLRAHQIEVMKASASDDPNHFGMVAEYADRIRQLRSVSNANAAPHDPAAPPTIIYGSYAGLPAQDDFASNAPNRGPDYDTLSENPDRGESDR